MAVHVVGVFTKILEIDHEKLNNLVLTYTFPVALINIKQTIA